jgi:hypothetical protein
MPAGTSAGGMSSRSNGVLVPAAQRRQWVITRRSVARSIMSNMGFLSQQAFDTSFGQRSPRLEPYVLWINAQSGGVKCRPLPLPCGYSPVAIHSAPVPIWPGLGAGRWLTAWTSGLLEGNQEWWADAFGEPIPHRSATVKSGLSRDLTSTAMCSQSSIMRLKLMELGEGASYSRLIFSFQIALIESTHGCGRTVWTPWSIFAGSGIHIALTALCASTLPPSNLDPHSCQLNIAALLYGSRSAAESLGDWAVCKLRAMPALRLAG